MIGELLAKEVCDVKPEVTNSFRDIKPDNIMSPKEMHDTIKNEFSNLAQEYNHSLTSDVFQDNKDESVMSFQENNNLIPNNLETNNNVNQLNNIENIFTETQESSNTQKELNNNSLDTLTNEQKQDLADKTAQDYNEVYKPYERAIEKGIEGVTKTENGGVSFAESDYIYTNDDGEKCIVSIEATGSRSDDFDAANEKMNLDETPDGFVWHHLDNYNVEDGTITLELVADDAHNASKPHSGGCAQYDAVNGSSYNPPRKGV